MKRTQIIWLSVIIPVTLGILLLGCESSTKTIQDGPIGLLEAPVPTKRALPTLYPTNTALPTPTGTATRAPLPTAIPETPVSFDQVVVDIRYTIPVLGLDRRIKANVSNQIEVLDEITGESVVQPNQPGVLLELQQALSDITLKELPPECESCVGFEYELPLADKAGNGWLDDARLLASIENYTAALIGPHFPENTVIGFRKSASAFREAFTMAITADGMLWRWRAVDPEIELPEANIPAQSDIFSTVDSLDFSQLSDSYIASCPDSTAKETLYLRDGSLDKEIAIYCPALSLPTSLLPVYLELIKLEPLPLAEDISAPEPPIPLDSLLYYQREDGLILTLLQDNRLVTVDEFGATYTGTITNTLAISITTDLIENGALEIGSETLPEEPNFLVVRGPEGVYSLGWGEQSDVVVEEALFVLDQLINIFIIKNSETTDLDITPTSTTAVTRSP